ncbi:MAG: patatin-like phospholipase family protein [Myxococcota bacterium]
MPIVREGQALVDGGLVNNVPANVLVQKDCNFVIASTVTAKLEQAFVELKAEQSHGQISSASILKVLLRANIVQNHNMNAVGVSPADIVIAPDVTAFDLSEFERTRELARIGVETTEGVVSTIKAKLNRLDPMLFPA